MKTAAIIPARYHSSRFPGKLLADIHGKTILQRVFEKAQAAGLDEVVVATDHEAILEHVSHFGGQAIMTATHHASGTERCAEALSQLSDAFDVIINLQGDEPFIAPEQIQHLREACQDPQTKIATLMQRVSDPDDLYSPNVVKVIPNQKHEALLFSRTAIPYLRNVKLPQWTTSYDFYSHLGIYAYRSETLQAIVQLPESPLEQAESLEQLRWLDHGYAIKLLESGGTGIAIDTPEDLEKARQHVISKENP